MTTQRQVLNSVTGQMIPVTTDLKVKPLTHSVVENGKMVRNKPVINGNGQPVMNDSWIYVNDGYGNYSINTKRAMYCQKLYMAEVTIQQSIGEKKLMDAELKLFVEKVSDRLVFQKYGKWYRVYLRKVNNRTFTIAKVQPYYCVYNPNGRFAGQYAYNLCIDWRSVFYVK